MHPAQPSKPEPPRVGTLTRPTAWLIAASLLLAVFTAPGAPSAWAFALTYVATAFALQAFVRTKSPEIERLLHVLVLAGSAPIVVRLHFGRDLPALVVVHVVAVLATSVGVGYWLAEQVRPQVRKPSRSSAVPRAGRDDGPEL